MTPPPIDLQRLLAEEPFVRALARQLVADAAQADDIAQQAWLQALERTAPGVRDPRRWFARIVQNLVHDLRRRTRRRATREDRGATVPQVPSSRELLEGEEVRRALVAAVDGLPAALRTVVLLRFYDGLPPRAIAAKLGVPAATVSHRLHEAIAQLRRQLDRAHGDDRRAWLLQLLPFANAPRALPFREVLGRGTAAATTIGVFTMTTKQILAGAIPLVLAVLWFAWPRDEPAGIGRAPEPTGAPPVVATVPVDTTPTPTPDAPPAPREDATPSAPKTGELLVHVRWGNDPQAVAGLTVSIVSRFGSEAYDCLRASTDSRGTAHFAKLPPGRYKVRVMPCPSLGCWADVKAGATTECPIELEHAIKVAGIVVDPTGTPVADAAIEVAFGSSPCGAETVTTSASDGTFAICPCDQFALVGARATGFAASSLAVCTADTANVRLEVQPNGGAVTGHVVDGNGKPIADAIVRIGTGTTSDIRPIIPFSPPMPAQVRSDAKGDFLTFGIQQGQVPVHVSHPSFAPFTGTCEVVAQATVDLRIMLSPGLTCDGTVRGEDGAVVPLARIQVGDRDDLWRQETFTTDDGTFQLRGLPPSGCELHAEQRDLGKASVRAQGEPGSTCHVDVTLLIGNRWLGRVLDEAGAPVANAALQLRVEGGDPGFERWANSDTEGRFVVADPPAGRTFAIAIIADGFDTWFATGAAPVDGFTAKLVRVTSPARVVGRVLRPDGTAANGAEVGLSRQWPHQQMHAVVDAEGFFAADLSVGTWRLGVDAPGHPYILRGPRTLQPGEVWDVGTLQLTVGGTLVLQKPADTTVDCRIFAPDGTFVASLYSPAPPLRSDALAPGDYVLSVQADGIAAQALPFTIHGSEETTLTLPMTPGVRQDVVFEATAGTTLRSVSFDLFRDGRRLCFATANGGTPARRESTLWLAPGDYELRTAYREPMTQARFTVGTAPGTPLRIQLR